MEKENSELVQAIKDFAEIKDEDNSTDNNPDNGEVKPEAPEVPEQSPETKPEAPEVPEETVYSLSLIRRTAAPLV